MKTRFRAWAVALLGAASLGACKDYLKVTNPGPIADENLNAAEAVTGLVSGMSGDLSVALACCGSGGALVRLHAIAGDELIHGGSYTSEGLFYRGIIRPEDVNSEWGWMQRARWVAETGIERMKAIKGYNYDTNVLSARANLYAGYANRLLGESVCTTAIDGGPEQPNTVHFTRAEAQFTEALRIATAANNAALQQAALAGRAQVRADLGQWETAAADAAQVPAGFVYYAVFSPNSSRENNGIAAETFNQSATGGGRREYSVFGTQWQNVFNDPRVPWDSSKAANGSLMTGNDGKTRFLRQRKYTDLGADIPLAKGTEMLMIRAEAALRKNDIAGAFALVNQQRAQYKLPALPVPTDIAAAWKTFEVERGAVTWLEARRLWDLRRWNAETGPAKNTFLDGRDKCVPISLAERQSNPNLKGG